MPFSTLNGVPKTEKKYFGAWVQWMWVKLMEREYKYTHEPSWKGNGKYQQGKSTAWYNNKIGYRVSSEACVF